MEKLNVKVGDVVIRLSWSGSSVHEVVKVTPAGYIDIKSGIGTERFSKSGNKLGSQKFEHASIRLPKDGEIEKIQREREFEHKRSYLRNYSYENLPLEALREMVDVIGKYEKK